MGHNISNFCYIGNTNTTTFLVPAGSTVALSVDVGEMINSIGLIEVTYPQTSSTTGITAKIFNGFGPPDSSISGSLPIPCKLGTPVTNGAAVNHGSSVPIWASNGTAITMSTMPPSQGSQQYQATSFVNTNTQAPRWQELQLVNTDLTFPATLRISFNFGV